VDNVQANGHIAYNVRSNEIYITLIKYIAIVTFVGYFEGCNCTVNVYALLDVDFLVPVMYTLIVYILIIWELSPNKDWYSCVFNMWQYF
jgi:hypothetical protein